MEDPTQIVVDVRCAPGSRRQGILTTEHPMSAGGVPILILDGVPLRAEDLPRGCRIVLRWRREYAGAVWRLVQKAKTEGRYPITALGHSKRPGFSE